MSSITRPVQLDEFTVAIRELDDGQLKTTRTELERAIRKLKATQNKLLKLCGEQPVHELSESESSSEDEYEQDRHLYQEIIAENELVLKNQIERVDRIDQELIYRGLK